MSVAVPSIPTTSARVGELRPSFVGLVRGELFKVVRQRTFWLMVVLLAGIMFLPHLVQLGSGNFKTGLQLAPVEAMYRLMGTDLLVVRAFVGIFIAIVTAQLIGMEYSYGTIRVVLGRGVSRLQLLLAEIAGAAVVAVVAVVISLAYNGVLDLLMLLIGAGNLDALKALPSTYWHDYAVYIGTILVSLALTILMAAAVTVLGRSLAFGLMAALAFFPADNFAVIFAFLGFRLTKNTFWKLISGDLLGPNLNAMAGVMLPKRAAAAAFGSFNGPLTPVTGNHTLLVAGIYAVIFAAVALGLTAMRDVKE